MTPNDVLIIGAGPSGLFVAAELLRYGTGVRLIEREVRLHRETRATTIQPGTLEILNSVGLLPPFLESAEHVRCTRMYGPDLSEIRVTSFEGIDCRCEFQCILPQYETQQILEAHLASVGGIVERGVTATKLELDANGLHVELVREDGGVETIQPGVVIGAGGRTASRAARWVSCSKEPPIAAISSSPTSRCRHLFRVTSPASSVARMACCGSCPSRAGAG
jgi:2-polyprenyl-6-methoxyphenol hydroxylase-like FAD-dependent oxidoreductase